MLGKFDAPCGNYVCLGAIGSKSRPKEAVLYIGYITKYQRISNIFYLKFFLIYIYLL